MNKLRNNRWTTGRSRALKPLLHEFDVTRRKTGRTTVKLPGAQSTRSNLKRQVRLLIGGILSFSLTACPMTDPGTELAEELSMIDCPLRDEPFSIDSPLMDIMLSPAASEIVNLHMDSVLETIPSDFAGTTAPSFSAIISLKMLASMGNSPVAALTAINRELAALEVTDNDRAARCVRYDSRAAATGHSRR